MKQINVDEKRTFAQILEHYEVEKELANRLRKAGKEERLFLYNQLYDELFQRVPNHPLLKIKNDPKVREKTVLLQFTFLKRFLRKDSVFLEIGSGDCRLALKVAGYVKKVYAVDVSTTIMSLAKKMSNLELVISDGCSIPIPKNSIDIAFSNHLMEHLHPDDALEQLKNIFVSLNNEGKYICRTPNLLYGPSDISKYFDDIATGFHLHEYTIGELENLFKVTGFSKVKSILRIKRFTFLLPTFPVKRLEIILFGLPRSKRTVMVNNPIIKKLLGINLVAYKSMEDSSGLKII